MPSALRAWTQTARDALVPTAAASAEVVERLAAQQPLVIETTAATRRMMRAKQVLEERYADAAPHPRW